MPVDDPNELNKTDQKIRINELKERIKEVTGHETEFHKETDVPPEVEEQFLEQVLAYETAPTTSAVEQLEKAGLKLPPPGGLKDEELPALLKTIFERMAARHMYVTSTNHLSDRELYERLYSDVLKEEMPEMPELPAGGGGWCFDMIGSGSEEDTALWLRYYADEETRQRWRKDYPDEKIPPHEDPPHARDRTLPQMELAPPLSDEDFADMMREMGVDDGDLEAGDDFMPDDEEEEDKQGK